MAEEEQPQTDAPPKEPEPEAAPPPEPEKPPEPEPKSAKPAEKENDDDEEAQPKLSKNFRASRKERLRDALEPLKKIDFQVRSYYFGHGCL